MDWLRRCGLMASALALLVVSAPLGAASPASPERDGQHDFDFEVGAWNIHLKKLLHPLTGSTTWIEFDGTSMTRRILSGHASIEQFETDGAGGHIEGLTLRLYNPQTRQWRLYWANSADGQLENPMVGDFQNGVGEFYDQELYQGRAIYVRFIWSQITPSSAHFEQSFSADGGKTWEVNWITDQTRTGPEPSWNQEQASRATTAAAGASSADPASDPQHDFNFDVGAWAIHMRRLLHPLANSSDWTTMDGDTVVHTLWGGRANLATVEADSPSSHLQLLALRLYNPAARQWSISFATADGGVLSVPCVGAFRDGRGEFYDQETLGSRSILVRFSIWPNGHDSVASEQAFSTDGGKTWETNWVNSMARRQDGEEP